MTPPRFTISILAVNKLQITQRCITTVLFHSQDFELILTDNGSEDGTGDYFDSVAAALPGKVRVIHHKENTGFWPAHNAAFALAQGVYFVCLNNDVMVPGGWLEQLLEPFEADPAVAVSGPLGPACVVDNNFHGCLVPGYREYIEGSCLMARVNTVKKYGLFDPKLPGLIYCEDSDLSLRMREQGYKLAWVHLALEHVGSATTKDLPITNQWAAQNQAYCAQKWRHYLKVRKFDYPILIKRSHATGDVLLTTPIIRHLRTAKPLAHIWVETGAKDVFRDNPNVEKVGKLIEATPETFVIDLNFAYENQPETNYLQAYAKVAEVELSTPESRKLDLFLNQEELGYAVRVLPTGNKWLAVHVGPTNWKGRDWPVERWRLCLAALLKDGWKTILIGHNDGTPFDVSLDLRGTTTLHQSAALIQQCRAFLGIDSLPLHLACAVGTPTVGLFGLSRPEIVFCGDATKTVGVLADKTNPSFGLRHAESQKGKQFVEDEHAVMSTISIEAVVSAVKGIL
jgi:ADP-heptose:LPS heptosyltransferase/GT2 family glycosyltransferase